MDAQMMFNLVVFALLAWLGLWIARRIRSPRNRWLKLLLLALLVVAPTIGVNTRLIDIVFVVYLNVALQGLVFGLIAGWWTKK